MYVCLRHTYTHVSLEGFKHTNIHAWKPKHIWFLESSEYRFEAFLGPGPKPLPERLRIMAREPFFGLERISGFWSRQNTVLKHIWALAENHCQNRLELWRASHFLVWSEYLVLESSEYVLKLFWVLTISELKHTYTKVSFLIKT